MKRIYKVTNVAGQQFLVKAATPAQAIHHLTRRHLQAEVASQDDLVALVGAGIAVETAGEDPQSAAFAEQAKQIASEPGLFAEPRHAEAQP